MDLRKDVPVNHFERKIALLMASNEHNIWYRKKGIGHVWHAVGISINNQNIVSFR